MTDRSFSTKLKRIAYGGDYNPEQWPEEYWAEDMRLFKEAGIDTVTLNVFSWATLEPSEGRYNFSLLDRIMENVTKNGMNVILATSTAAHPAWMAKKYPEILRVEFDGQKRKYGARHNSCPNSPVYRRAASALAGALAARYKTYGNIVAWHISNEFSSDCYCENCEKAFRRYLREKYKTIGELNRAWCTSFWSHTFYDFDEIVAPNLLTEMRRRNESTFQGIALDYRRFLSDSMMECCALEAKAIKAHTPDIPVTTNFMHFFRDLDYRKWADVLDFTSWDAYPAIDQDREEFAIWHDYMRSLKKGQPFLLMEQTPSVTNWQRYNFIRRPGVVRLSSYEAIAHGADGVLFFQLRRSRGSMEKMHGAVIDHVGTGDTRAFREIKAIGQELDALGDTLLGARTNAKVALVFDYDNLWSSELCCGPSSDPEYKDYVREVMRYYKALNDLNVSTDLVWEESDFSGYRVVIAPILYMVKPGFREKIEAFVKEGGIFIASAFSGMVDETDLVYLGGQPGPLRDVLGIFVEEIDCLPPDRSNSFVYGGVRYEAKQYFDVITRTEKTCRALSAYESDFYAGCPTVTKNGFGNGFGYYVATRSSEEFYRAFLSDVIKEAGVEPLAGYQPGLEVTERENGNGRFLFYLNHGDAALNVTPEVSGRDLLSGETFEKGKPFSLNAKGVVILKTDF